MAGALRPLESVSALPEPGYETKQSDIVGLLRRISQDKELGPRFFIVVTDLADTRYKVLPPILAPEAQVHVTVVLVPAWPKDALLTIGKALSGPEQYEFRSRQLREAAPWAAAVPYFSQNLANTFTKPKDGAPTSP